MVDPKVWSERVASIFKQFERARLRFNPQLRVSKILTVWVESVKAIKRQAQALAGGGGGIGHSVARASWGAILGTMTTRERAAGFRNAFSRRMGLFRPVLDFVLVSSKNLGALDYIENGFESDIKPVKSIALCAWQGSRSMGKNGYSGSKYSVAIESSRTVRRTYRERCLSLLC